MVDDRDVRAPNDATARLPRGLRTGIEEIDRAHERLLQEVRESLRGDAEPIATLRELQRHVLLHFAEEERIMRAAGYPEFEGHREEHRKIADFVANVSVELVDKGPDTDYVGVSNRILFNWLVDHVKTADADLALFLRQRGATRRPT